MEFCGNGLREPNRKRKRMLLGAFWSHVLPEGPRSGVLAEQWWAEAHASAAPGTLGASLGLAVLLCRLEGPCSFPRGH